MVLTDKNATYSKTKPDKKKKLAAGDGECFMVDNR